MLVCSMHYRSIKKALYAPELKKKLKPSSGSIQHTVISAKKNGLLSIDLEEKQMQVIGLFTNRNTGNDR